MGSAQEFLHVLRYFKRISAGGNNESLPIAFTLAVIECSNKTVYERISNGYSSEPGLRRRYWKSYIVMERIE